MGRLVDRRRVTRFRDGRVSEVADHLAVEDPLTVQVNGATTTTTMRTPGHDIELALGWLVSEGVVRQPSDVVGAIACDENTVEVRLALGVTPPAARLTMQSSACGICGTDSISDVVGRRGSSLAMGHHISPEVIASLPDRLRDAQSAFDRTGGLHAAGLFTLDGDPVCVREDVGRHNAVDKVVGWALQRDDLPANEWLLQVSGRASFELTQKAVMAGVPVLAAVSAPSTLAVDLARESGLTLVGFSRGTSFNVYAGAERLTPAAATPSPAAQPG
ncbi:MAG TPA: formate dehydrogenase accessory sulfurtransferase FdhD [Actinomycetes bacterium]|nr:formate dehydrogenase accessory sulfurtransferase FdhD [Actinomycetes bacterium]